MLINLNSDTERFDWDEYNKDVRSGISATDQIKKCKRGGYITTNAVSKKPANADNVLDFERYNNDIEVFGEAYAEVIRRNGGYKYKRSF